MTPQNACAECGGPADRTLLCAKCRPIYDRLVTDECGCVSCRSDLARITPCEKEQPL